MQGSWAPGGDLTLIAGFGGSLCLKKFIKKKNPNPDPIPMFIICLSLGSDSSQLAHTFPSQFLPSVYVFEVSAMCLHTY